MEMVLQNKYKEKIMLVMLLSLLGDASAEDCATEMADEMSRYQTVGGLSLLLTLVNMFLRIALKVRFESSPKDGYRFFFGMAAIKFLLGFLLFTVFWPSCPDGCSCYSTGNLALYPTVVLVVAVLWTVYGTKYYKRAQQLAFEESVAVTEIPDATKAPFSDQGIV